MRLMRLFSMLCALLLFTACGPTETGVVFNGEDCLDQETFTGTYTCTFMLVTEPYTMLSTELEEGKTVRVRGEGEVNASGKIEPFELYCKTADGKKHTIFELKEAMHGMSMAYSGHFDQEISLPAGKNRLILRGNAKGLSLDLSISDVAPS